MAAWFIVHIHIEEDADRRSYDEYIDKVRPVVESFGGRYLVRSENITPVAGDFLPTRFIAIRFESREKLEACFNSKAYKAISPLREINVTSHAFIVED